MKKFTLITSCLLFLAGTAALPVMAQETPAPPAAAEAPAPAPPPASEGEAPEGEAPGWIAHGSITGGAEFFWEDSGSAKFNEYRYKQSEPWGGFGGLNAYAISPDGSHRMDLSIDYRSPEDLDVDLTSQTFGQYKFDFGFQRMGHVFAYDAKTIYNGTGTGLLTINPAVKAAILSGVPSTLPQTTAGLQTLASNLNGVLAKDAQTTDLLLRRDKLGADLDLNMLWPVDLDLGFIWENRDGSRPYGGTFGFGNAVEIAEPIQYDTYNAKAGLEYADSILFARANYYHSTFDNHIDSITYENPFRLTNSLGGEAASYGAGSVFARNALPPDNRYDNINGALGVNLPLRTRVLFIGSYAWEHQNSPLLPPTINSAVVLPFDSPRAKADAEVESKQFELRITSSPVEKLSLKADFKYFDHINNTPVEDFPSVVVDAGGTPPNVVATSTPEYNSWISRSAEGEIAYEILPKTNIGINYKYLDQTYFFEFSRSELENTEKYFIDTRNLDWLTAKLSFQHSDRESNYADEDITEGQPPLMRKFHMADRDRYMADAIVTVMPIDPLSFSLEYNYGRDRYDESFFGLQLSKFQTATVDVDVRVAKWVSLNAFYTYEYNSQSQEDRQSNAATVAGLIDPNSPSNWNLRTRSNIQTVGLGSDMTLVPDFISMKAEGTWSKVQGKAFFSSIVGPTASANPADVDLNAFVPDNFNSLDNNQFWKAMVQLRVRLTKKIQATLGYQYESWNVKDYQRDGLTYVKTNNVGAYNSLLDMNTLYQPYVVHSVFTSLTYFF
jgi:MtrB/PioB family decaheme-associated outer membrane protein